MSVAIHNFEHEFGVKFDCLDTKIISEQSCNFGKNAKKYIPITKDNLY